MFRSVHVCALSINLRIFLLSWIKPTKRCKIFISRYKLTRVLLRRQSSSWKGNQWSRFETLDSCEWEREKDVENYYWKRNFQCLHLVFFCVKVKLIVGRLFLFWGQQNTTEWMDFCFLHLHYLTLCGFDEDDSGFEERGDILPQLRRVFLLLLSSCCPLLLNLINLEGDSCGDGVSESWHPLRWKFNIKSQTDGGEGFDGGGRM